MIRSGSRHASATALANSLSPRCGQRSRSQTSPRAGRQAADPPPSDPLPDRPAWSLSACRSVTSSQLARARAVSTSPPRGSRDSQSDRDEEDRKTGVEPKSCVRIGPTVSLGSSRVLARITGKTGAKEMRVERSRASAGTNVGVSDARKSDGNLLDGSMRFSGVSRG
jgi:hypothetical protein